MQRKSWLRLSTIFAACTLLVLFFTSQLYFFFENQGNPVPLWEAFLWASADWYMWAALAPVVFAISRRFPMDLKERGRHVFVHMAAAPTISFAFLFGALLLELFVHKCVGESASAMDIFRTLFVQKFLLNVLIYGGLVSMDHAVEFYHRYRERELRASQLETRLATAQLNVLKMQLQPHFLFNTLNTISALMHSDVDAADNMIARLSDLLRYSLRNVGVQQVTFRQELDFLKGYLEIEQTRFRDRLTVKIDVQADVMDVPVPSFILQPLVENAIRHGIAPRSGPGLVELRARRSQEQLIIDIRDDGLGLPPGFDIRETTGVGVNNIRERLDKSHGAQQHFSIKARPDGGVHVQVCLPCTATSSSATLSADSEEDKALLLGSRGLTRPVAKVA